MRTIVALGLIVGLVGFVSAGELAEGDKEIALRASFSDTDFGTTSGFDLGTSETTELGLTYGWLLTDHHELGLVVSYSKEEIDGGNVGVDSEIDGNQLGGFYNYNFGSGSNMTPYLGALVSKLGGDLGDAYDFQYAAEVGMKFYPWKHGGISVGLSYSELRADADGLPDAETLNLGVGLLLKY